jgi:hypothetical protein
MLQTLLARSAATAQRWHPSNIDLFSTARLRQLQPTPADQCSGQSETTRRYPDDAWELLRNVIAGHILPG